MAETNEHYLSRIGVTDGSMQKCLEVLERYGEDRWWLSDDPRKRAYYQLNEDVVLMPFAQFREDIEVLLNRPVWTYEMVSPKIKEEAERAWRWGVGATSDKERKERKERSEESVQDLRDVGKEKYFD